MSSSSSYPAIPIIVAAALGARALSSRGKKPAKRVAGPKPVPIDSTFGDPELARLQQAARVTNWPGMAAILQPVRDRGDYERLTWMIGNVEGLGGDFLLKLPERLPDDALARTVSGARHVAWAWEARTGYRASQVSQEQFRTFHERLRVAEEHLYAAVELDPGSAAPWYSLAISSRGLQHGHAVTRRRFEAGSKRAPHHVGLHRQLLQQVCAKWSGSHEEMHAFAKESMEKAPPGSAMGELVATAHIEHWLDLERGEDAAYVGQPHVLAELKEAAAKSVFHAAFAPTSSPYGALNEFAMAFWLAGDKASAHELFKRIGDHPTKSPWQYRGDPEKVFAAVRHDCKKRK